MKAGYGGRFTSCFEEVGLEDTEDIAHIGAKAMAELEVRLVAAGAKVAQVEKVQAAVAALGAKGPVRPSRPVRPSPSKSSSAGSSPLQSRAVTTGVLLMLLFTG